MVPEVANVLTGAHSEEQAGFAREMVESVWRMEVAGGLFVAADH